MDLKERVLEGELMDAPDLDQARHKHALRGLRRVNRLSGTGRVISRAILRHEISSLGRPLRILDLACGGGDVTMAVARQLAARGVAAHVEGWDRSPTAVDCAALELSTGRVPSDRVKVVFHERDAMQLDCQVEFDIVMCTLFLHHLSCDDARKLLGKMYKAARHLVLVDDLRRTWFGYRLAQLGCQLLTRSPIVHVDGPLSVRAAFTELELQKLSLEADLPQPRCVRHWPQRFLAAWDRVA